MGLCKCPKRKVTNLFCFEHRVNVCEHCLVENHPRCVVQSYLNWLKDSDYNPDCQLCSKPLANGNVVRLLCYDVFHEACLDRHFRKLPANTAPAGYKCSICDIAIFPAQNQGGKVVEQLRQSLSKFNWARTGLGMPLIEESEIADAPATVDQPEDDPAEPDDGFVKVNRNADVEPLHGSSIPKPNFDLSSQEEVSWQKKSKQFEFSPPTKKSDTTIMMDDFAAGAGKTTDEFGAVSRKLLGTNLPDSLKKTVTGHDPDSEDKYKRRSAFTWFSRWLRSRMLRGRSRGYHDINVIPKRMAILLLVGIIAFFTIIIFATQVGQKRAQDNPFLDPLANPNIHIGGNEAFEANNGNDFVGDDGLDNLKVDVM